MKEEWREIEKHTRYEVSNTGKIRNKKTERILTPHNDKTNSGNHLNIVLRSDASNIPDKLSVARTVYRAFINPDIDSNHRVIHKDGNSENNNVNNLEEISTSEYMKMKSAQFGSRNMHNRLIYEPETNTVFLSILRASEYYDLEYHTLCRYINAGKSYHGRTFIHLEGSGDQTKMENINLVY